jgi:hypothetical protein
VAEVILTTDFALINDQVRALIAEGECGGVKVVLKGYKEYVVDGCRKDFEGS